MKALNWPLALFIVIAPSISRAATDSLSEQAESVPDEHRTHTFDYPRLYGYSPDLRPIGRDAP